jgi:hypothetical protein
MRTSEFEREVEAARWEFQQEVEAVRREVGEKMRSRKEASTRQIGPRGLHQEAGMRKADALLHELEQHLLKQKVRL